MSTKQWILSIIFLALIVWFVVANKSGAPEGPIKIGVLAPLTGLAADYGEEIRKGVIAGAASGPEVEFVFADTACGTTKTLSAFQKLTDFDGVQFIIGPGCGAPQEVIAPLVEEKDVLVVVPSAAARSLHETSGGKMFFTQYALEDESKFIADSMYELGHEKVILISFQNAFSEVHVRAFKEHFQGEIVSEIAFPNETMDVASELVKIKDVEADAIFSTDVTFALAQGAARLEQYNIDLPVFSQYAMELPAIRDLVPEGLIYSFPEGVGEGGAIFEFSKISAENLLAEITECQGRFECVRRGFTGSGDYDEFGVRNQTIILKQMKGGEAVLYE